MLRARLIAGVPADLVGVADRADRGPLPRRRPRPLRRRPPGEGRDQAREGRRERRQRGRGRRQPPRGRDLRRRGLARRGHQRRRGQEDRPQTKARGRYMILQDVYGNRYMYAGLGKVSELLPGAARTTPPAPGRALEGRAREGRPAARRARVEGQPAAHAAAGREPRRRARRAHGGEGAPVRPPRTSRARARTAASSSSWRPRAATRLETYDGRFARPIRLDPRRFKLRPPAQGRARDRRHRARPARQDRARQGRAPRLLDPPGRARARRGSTPSRSSTAGSCSRPPRSTAPRANAMRSGGGGAATRSARSC